MILFLKLLQLFSVPFMCAGLATCVNDMMAVSWITWIVGCGMYAVGRVGLWLMPERKVM